MQKVLLSSSLFFTLLKVCTKIVEFFSSRPLVSTAEILVDFGNIHE